MNETPSRIAALRDSMSRAGLSAFLVTEPGNRRYLTGFTGSAGLLLVLQDSLPFLVDSRYYEQVPREAPDLGLEKVGYQPLPRLAEILRERGIHEVGFEPEHATVETLRKWREQVEGVTWKPIDGLVGSLRTRKSETEIGLIRRAVDLADLAMEEAFRVVRPGMSERGLAWQLEVFMRERGAESLAFDIIVAAGENGALPHHRASDRVIGEGEPIVIDMGCILDGYCSDLTRTFSLGPAVDSEYDRVWATVDAANRAAVAGLVPGMTGKAGDALARDLIAAAGYGDRFGHSLGHGVGLAVHEGPRLSALADAVVLPAGAVVTVEPGIYLPGRFGVRIEDMVVLRDGGAELLTRVARPAVLPLTVQV
jgi:Xaa-Pro aminopeptidase